MFAATHILALCVCVCVCVCAGAFAHFMRTVCLAHRTVGFVAGMGVQGVSPARYQLHRRPGRVASALAMSAPLISQVLDGTSACNICSSSSVSSISSTSSTGSSDKRRQIWVMGRSAWDVGELGRATFCNFRFVLRDREGLTGRHILAIHVMFLSFSALVPIALLDDCLHALRMSYLTGC